MPMSTFPYMKVVIFNGESCDFSQHRNIPRKYLKPLDQGWGKKFETLENTPYTTVQELYIYIYMLYVYIYMLYMYII